MKVEAYENLDFVFSSVGFQPMKEFFCKEPQMIHVAQNKIKMKCLMMFSFSLDDYLPWEVSKIHHSPNNHYGQKT